MAEAVLIVTESGDSVADLCQALADDNVPALVRAPGQVLAGLTREELGSDVVLVDAALDPRTTRRVIDRITHAAVRAPAMLSFATDEPALLEAHLDAGLDYLLPPFLPYLVRRRLLAGRKQREFDDTVSQLAAGANSLAYERDLQIGREIQRGFLPEALPAVPGWDIAAYFEPAREVGGDFYDAYDIINGSHLGFAIADVCDKGIGAALFMALIRSLLRQAAAADDAAGPASAALRAVRTTNEYLTTNHLQQAYFATLFFGVVDPATGELLYINCGHNPPILRRTDGEDELLTPTGPALGLIREADFGLNRVRLGPDDLLFLYTDGVTEAKNGGGDFLGEPAMHELLAGTAPATEVIARMTAAVAAHRGSAEQFDDVTMLALGRTAARLDESHPKG
jgi:sigma-B regulation protein RsbU (phosphoserine phosphatase)